jgi:lysophospholipase L1-like esterase
MAGQPNKRIYLIRGVFLFGSLVFALFLGEIALRILNLHDGRVHLNAFTEYDPLLGWKIAPNASTRVVTQDFQTALHYSAKGLRGPDRPYAKPPGKSRILILGDSMVDGYSVPLEARVSEVLEKQLAPKSDVVNLGVSAYSTDQELLMLETEGWKYQPDLVVLFLYYNDIWMNGDRLLGGATFKPVFKLDEAGNLVLQDVPVPKPAPALEDRSKLYALLRDTMKASPKLYSLITFQHRPSAPSPMPAGAGGTADEFRVYQKTETPDTKRVWDITQALLRRMKRETREHGADLLLFYVPTRVELSPQEWVQSQIPPEYDPTEVVGNVVRICQTEQIPLIEPSNAFRDAGKQKPLFYAHDVHMTAAGHLLSASLVADYVQRSWRGGGDVSVSAQSR